MRSRGLRSQLIGIGVATLVAVLVTTASCGQEDDVAEPGQSSNTTLTLEQQVENLDSLLRESIAQVGLDPRAGRRELVDNPCVGEDGAGKNLRFYFDEPSHDRGVEYLRALEEHWGTGDFELSEPEPFQDDGELVSLLAVSGPFRLEGWWFPDSKELTIGGSTPCVSGHSVPTTAVSTDPPTSDEPGSTSTTAP